MDHPLWRCGYNHVFEFPLDSGYGQARGVPSHCQADFGNGEPCMDSTELYPENDEAEAAQAAWAAL